MHTKVGVSPAYVLSQLSTAVVGAACFIATIAFVNSAKNALFEPSLHVSPSQFSWMSSLQFDVERDVKFPTSAIVPDLEKLVSTDVSQDLKKISLLEVKAKKDSRRNWAHLARVARARAEALDSDAVRISQAQAEYIPAPGAETASDMTEEQKIQNVHSFLMNQFQVAMNSIDPSTLTTQVAKATVTQPAAASDLGLDNVPEAPKSPNQAPHHTSHQPAAVVAKQDSQQDKAEQEVPAAQLVTAEGDSIHTNAASESIDEMPAPPVTTLDAKTAAIDELAKRAEKMQGYEDVPPPPPADSDFRPIEVTSNTTAANSFDSVPEVNPAAMAAAAPAAPVTTKKDTPQAQSETVSFMGTTLVLPPEYPKTKSQSGYSPAAGGSVNSHNPGAAAQQPAARSASAVAANDVDPADDVALMKAISAVPSILAAAPEAQSAPNVSFVEAFNWGQSVSDAQAEILTREDATEAYGQSHTGWRIARSPDHWPSVYWNQSGLIPMLSKNAAKMLALKTGSALQEEAGILIAKAPPGWSLEFSGRSEHPLIFSETNQLMATDSIERTRYYVFMNASPGAQLLYLVKSGETGVLALPVFGGMLSFADLSQPEKRTLVGKVLDIAGNSTHGTGGIRVQVIGSGQTTVTNGSGSFKMPNVISFGNQAIFLETESNHGYPHRYKINPRSAKVPLFQLGEDQVHDWVGQLEGGISTESGLIVGAMPTIAAANEDRKPVPSIKTLATDPTLVPETYTVSASGQLLVKTPITAANSRVIGVQVPEGPALVQLTDKDGKVLWSELLVISPRVLSVVGPY